MSARLPPHRKFRARALSQPNQPPPRLFHLNVCDGLRHLPVGGGEVPHNGWGSLPCFPFAAAGAAISGTGAATSGTHAALQQSAPLGVSECDDTVQYGRAPACGRAPAGGQPGDTEHAERPSLDARLAGCGHPRRRPRGQVAAVGSHAAMRGPRRPPGRHGRHVHRAGRYAGLLARGRRVAGMQPRGLPHAAARAVCTVTASGTYGCSLWHIWLQPLAHMVAGLRDATAAADEATMAQARANSGVAQPSPSP